MPKKKSREDLQKYRMGTFDDKNIFEHELVYVLFTGRPIPKNTLIFHMDNNTLNNDPRNLFPGPEKNNDYHISKNKVFHEDHIEENIPFIKEHFPEVYQHLNLADYHPDMFAVNHTQEDEEQLRTGLYEHLKKVQ